MPRPKAVVPAYCRQREKGRPDRAFVRIGGRKIILGRYDSPRSREWYAQLLAESKASPVPISVPTSTQDGGITITELVAAFLIHAEQHYRKPDGTITAEVDNFRAVLKLLRELYGRTPAAAFGPKRLRAVRQAMIEGDKPAKRRPWCRYTANKQTGRIRMMFKWAVAQELIGSEVHHALTTLAPLQKGRTAASESDPVKPVDEQVIEATLPYLSKQVRAMVELQLVTGARPGEIVAMRPCDIDRTVEPWQYKLPQHKTAHHGHERVIFLGKKAQAIITPYLLRPDDKPLFSPAEAERDRRAVNHQNRKTPADYGNRPGTNQRRYPKRPPGDAYDVASYRRAISRAVKRADHRAKGGRIVGNDEVVIPDWHPNQLRHNAATRLRAEYGLETAQVILGHATLSVTQVYAEKNVALARKVMTEVG